VINCTAVASTAAISVKLLYVWCSCTAVIARVSLFVQRCVQLLFVVVIIAQ
jgi:hypothetical protein